MRAEYDFSKGERGKFSHPDARLNLPVHDVAQDWAAPNENLGSYIAKESQRTINAYASQPHLVIEHANLEQDTARGGYAHRQLFELVQNGADALSGASDRGRLAIRLTDCCLYCADDGEPISRDGVTALMFSHMSPKRGTSEIGRFGLGFKSVLGVSDTPEFFCRAGSFRFDRGRAHKRIREAAPAAKRCPVLRVADPIDPHEARDKDPILRQLMDWATNVVRLPLKPDAASDLRRQMRDFPSEFLLFVEHVRQLTINDGTTLDRVVELKNLGGEFRLMDGNAAGNWKLFNVVHSLSSEARADRRSLDDGDEVPIWWAVPLDRLNVPGSFWAYFPTKTTSLVAGILNAPWKTNEDRQNLLPGPYNDELIDAAAAMIAENLSALATPADPARHLDALPRRHEAGDSAQSERLRECLLAGLCDRDVIPDQDGILRRIPNVNYPPEELTSDSKHGVKPLQRWTQYSGRPSNWLHHRAIPRNRLARIEQLIEQWQSGEASPFPSSRRASMSEWLKALVEGKTEDAAVAASRAALLTAADIPPQIRRWRPLGSIVLMQNGAWRQVDPEHVFLPRGATDTGSQPNAGTLVHARLASDPDAGNALSQLGIKVESPDNHLKRVASTLLRDGSGIVSEVGWHEFWEMTREVEPDLAEQSITKQKDWRKHLRVRTQAGAWNPMHRVLLPGSIVPRPDRREQQVAVDLEFHEADEELMERLDVVSTPGSKHELSVESWFDLFRNESRHLFLNLEMQSRPHSYLLEFSSTLGAGPLDVLDALSDEGRVDYTNALLDLDATYTPWTMRHGTRPEVYPALSVASPAVRRLRASGRLRTARGVVPFEDALGPQPKSRQARDVLLAHPKADKIKIAFDLSDPTPEFFGEEDPIPLSDVWPGFWPLLEKSNVDVSNVERHARLVHCERIMVGGDERNSILHASSIYLRRSGDVSRELVNVLQLVRGLVDSPDDQLLRVSILILGYTPPPTIDEQRTAVRELATDAERLLKAVGGSELRRLLPGSLLAVLKRDARSLDDIAVAEAAIATHHTGALRHYRHALDHLGPPRQWAGSPRAVDFVQSLGFSAEWAGERNVHRAPFVEVEGPYSLPALHDFQKTIVVKVRTMLRGVGNQHQRIGADSTTGAVVRDKPANSRGRRGMISLPTGSGKTRVAVQAIVQAMRHDGFSGGVLWVADRDELCEQVVEAWRQVWSSVGAQGTRLRISRMWAGQPGPLPACDLHVIVATIQTLRARFQNRRSEYDFLSEFTLVVFDEAHRSIAPTFTSVMQEIGLTRWQRDDEPFLIGLTATPYRGHDEEETERLVKRYGRQRLDAGAFASDDPEDVVSELQDMHVLALADHQTIDGGHFSLNDEELAQMKTEPRPPWLPRSVEDRIAQDAVRTNRIVDAYLKQVRDIDPEWPALIFATSVEHAQTIAALLSRTGVPSRAVSGTTESSIRRRIVEEFRRGDLKVLVNYGVFREGFDAPKTRAILVARPVYSPNLYFQMIGRGLRGERNGGTDRCLIINVQDNIENFERKLAFSDLDWLWA